jgi:hypothetical protein
MIRTRQQDVIGKPCLSRGQATWCAMMRKKQGTKDMINQYTRQRFWQRPVLPLFGLFFLLCVLVGLAPARPTLAAGNSNDVMVTLTANPSIAVARGTLLAYKLRVENHGDTTLAYARLRLPYERSKVVFVNTEFQDNKDYVYKIEEDTITIHIDSLEGSSARFAVLYMYVGETLPAGTVLNMWAGFDWEDTQGKYGINKRSNAAPVLVGESNQTSDYVWMTATPGEGSPDTQFNFFSDRFIPGEKVTVWRLGPGDTRHKMDEKFSNDADPNGRIHIHLKDHGLPAGTHTIMLQGKHSDLQAVTSITITP